MLQLDVCLGLIFYFVSCHHAVPMLCLGLGKQKTKRVISKNNIVWMKILVFCSFRR